MRPRTAIAAAVTVLVSSPAWAEKIAQDFKSAFERSFRPRMTYAVIVQAGVPTTSVYGVKGDQTDAHYAVDIKDGRWATSQGLLDFNQVAADFLGRGELLELASMSYKDNRIDMRLVSVEAHKVSRGSGFSQQNKREPVATYFKFFFPFPVSTAQDVPRALEYVGEWLRPFPNEQNARVFAAQLLAGGAVPPPAAASTGAAAVGASQPAAPAGRKEIKVGMTSLEVIEILGKPQKEVSFETRTRWTYPDLTVLFENGRVKEVKF